MVANVDTPDDQLLSVVYGDMEDDFWGSKHQISLSELAARLDSRQFYDFRGNYYWSNDFESNILKWRAAMIGGSTVNRDATIAYKGAASMRLRTGIAVLSAAVVHKDQVLPPGDRIGFEATISFIGLAHPSFRITTEWNNGTLFYRGGFRIVPATGVVQIMSSLGGWVDLGVTICCLGIPTYWHRIKFVIDQTTGYYTRLLLDGIEYDIRNYPLFSGVSANCRRWVSTISISGDNVAAYDTHIDNTVFTYHEPE